ncbi:hypothetical protein KAR91_83650 [Candidatus Pacearchaeota archaeon]|nr:hypothetical protein [Candidatus Pacearchaeota archaeon]
MVDKKPDPQRQPAPQPRRPVVKVSKEVFDQYIGLLENLTIACEHQDPTEVEKAAIPARIFLNTVRDQASLVNLVVV